MGYYIGVGGVVTFKNAKKLKETVEDIPLERILLETDCPYMAPEPHRGSRNDSTLLPFVAAEVARIKGVSEQEVIDITKLNAEIKMPENCSRKCGKIRGMLIKAFPRAYLKSIAG